MTIHHMQLIHQDQINLRLANDDSSTASSEAEIKTTTPLKTKPDVEPVIRRKSVRFTEENNEYFDIQHVDDLDPEEIANTWYSRREYSMIRSAYSVTVRIMTTTTRCLNDSMEHCTRGLEYRTPEGSQKRQTNKWNAVEAVLDEQHRQREEHVNDDEAISSVYKAVAFHCQQEALERGLADATDASSAGKPSPEKTAPIRRMSRAMMRDPTARRRAVLEDLQKMLSVRS